MILFGCIYANLVFALIQENPVRCRPQMGRRKRRFIDAAARARAGRWRARQGISPIHKPQPNDEDANYKPKLQNQISTAPAPVSAPPPALPPQFESPSQVALAPVLPPPISEPRPRQWTVDADDVGNIRMSFL